MRYFTAPGEDRNATQARLATDRGAFVTLSDGITHYELSGDPRGPVVVLLPGLTIPLTFWDDVVARLCRHRLTTLTYSSYGRGCSDRPEGSYDRVMFARQLRELLAELGIGETHLIASSMGALIALEHCRAQPGAVASLTLSGPAGFGAARNAVGLLPERGPIAPLIGKHLLGRNIDRHLEHNVNTPAGLVRLRTLLRESFRIEGTAYAILSTLMHFPLRDQDDLFDATSAALPPTALFWGTADRVTPVADFDRAAALLRPQVCARFVGVGHMVPFEAAERFAAHAAEFLGALG